ncbi:hypothetical protein [Oscillibacter sp.]|uniref:hypothetical protein n=1 Tax=Oscillibacter sp. TaxID=1945593 RepID=UPI00259063E0|nr:hypothetical protein [Oscillibacter sp.]
MKINTYRTILEQMWQKDKKCFASDAEFPPHCLRCGKPLNKRLVVNALSRYADVHICEDCGMDEALRDACGQVLPMWEWYALSYKRDMPFHCDGPALTTDCSFNHIYTGSKKLFPFNHLEHPVSEMVYSRSDYDGHKWWTTWHHSDGERPTTELATEIDQFTEALFQLPEFKTLDTMRCFCRASAQPTSESTEFNLYAATEHFYIWLRMITRPRDYNLYCHFYLKETADGSK